VCIIVGSGKQGHKKHHGDKNHIGAFLLRTLPYVKKDQLQFVGSSSNFAISVFRCEEIAGENR
jgi:hypothetical protein